MNKKILYISYDGLIENISLSQIVPYLKFFSKYYSVDTFSLEKKNKSDNRLNNFFSDLQKYKIKSFYNYYINKKKYYYLINLLHVICRIQYIIIKNKYDLIHIRSLMPSLFIFPLLLFMKCKLIFDIRGFWIDEKVDRYGLRINSIKYKFFKFFENLLLKKSDYIICLTNESKNIIIEKNKIYSKKIIVIPTCVDTELFKPNYKIKESKITYLTYLGSTKGAYDLKKVVFEFKKLLEINNHFFLTIISRDNHLEIINIFQSYNIAESYFKIISLKREKLISELIKNDIGIFYLNKNYSIKASFPTKIAEYLSLGIPIICNNFNEDINLIMNKYNIGKIYNFESTNNNNLYQIIQKIKNDKNIKRNCIDLANNEFSLKNGLQKYKKVYNNLLNE